jgi:endonuclease/exonuclease/phosphatase family metal-dependent hydrolase
MRARLDEHTPGLICVTEGHENFLDGSGHTIAATEVISPYPGRRKVLLWSRAPWESVDQIGHPMLPEGRFIAGRTATPIGMVNVIGVCIPWFHAHVTVGRRDRKPWEEHCTFLSGLTEVLSNRDQSRPTILLGDFNQTLPRTRAPMRAYEALRATLPSDMIIATEGLIPDLNRLSIDHVAHTRDLEAVRVQGLSNWSDKGRRLSDHFGLAVELQAVHGPHT